MKTTKDTRAQLQKCLDQAMKLQGTIAQIDKQIEKFENSLLGTGWSEGNIKIGWVKGESFSQGISTSLMNRDRIFSLSSITSHASTHLTPLQNQKTTPCDGPRFYKKKKKHIKKRSQSQSKKEKAKTGRRKGRCPKSKIT